MQNYNSYVDKRVKIPEGIEPYMCSLKVPEGNHFGVISYVYKWDDEIWFFVDLEDNIETKNQIYKSFTVRMSEVIIYD